MRATWFTAIVLVLFPTLTIVAADNSALSLLQYTHELQQLRQAVVSIPDAAAATSLSQQLPPEWKVDADRGTFAVTTFGLAVSLRAYAREPNPGNLSVVTSQIDLLLSDAHAMESARLNADPERRQLTEILSRSEFRNVKGESWYDRIKREVQKWLAHLFERMLYSSAFPVVSRITIWILLAAAVAVVGYWVVRNYRQTNLYTTFAGSLGAVSAKPWRDWQAEAQAAANEGRWRDAVHLSYWSAISFLEGQGLWRPDRARTPREYLRLLSAGDTHRDPLRELTQNFERVWYGTDTATEDTFNGATAILERLGCR